MEILKRFLRNNAVMSSCVYNVGKLRAKKIVKCIEPHLFKEDVLLDFGAGTCNICEILKRNEFHIFPLDVVDLSFVKDITPILFDGKRIPFDSGEFDVALVLTVLHHTSNPEEILQEIKRVSKKIIIIEDIYSNRFNKYLTYFFDSLFNLEFSGHPHSNKTDIQWRKLFEDLELRIINAKYNRSFFGFSHATYFLEK